MTLNEGSAKPSLDAVRFNTTGYPTQGEPKPGSIRVWHTPEGDGLGLYFFQLPPDLPHTDSIDELTAYYCQLLNGPESGAKVVEVTVIPAGGCQAIRTIISVPQEPHGYGRTYVGSLTVPFRDFSFVLKCQCAEHGTTGIREAILIDNYLNDKGSIKDIEELKSCIFGFNTDDPKYDAKFPNHPLSRTRRVLAHVAGSLIIADEIKRLPSFILPSPCTT